FSLPDVSVVPVRAGDKELRTRASVEYGPISGGRLPQDGLHLGLGIRRAVPHKPFALRIDPNGRAVEGVQAALAGRVTRVHQACRVKQLVIELSQSATGFPRELQSTAQRVEPRAKQDARAVG